MADPTYPLFPIFAFLGFVLSLIPLPWHLEAWNSGTCYYMIWTAISCLNQFVNSVVWHNNALNPAPVWCDISIRIMLGASVGIPAASLCINRRLYHIASVQAVTVTRAEKRRAILIDSLICVLLPIVFIALQYVVQGHRYDIYEDIGCYPEIYNTSLAYLIGSPWTIILGLISAVYCILSLRAFLRRRTQFSEFLSSNKSLTISRYFRLMALAMTEIICTTPLAIFVIWLNVSAQPLQPWISWTNVHFNWSRVDQIPSAIWRMDYLLVVAMELSRWIVPVCAFLFFGFFGFAEEARKHYRAAYRAVAKRLGLSPQGIKVPFTLSLGHPFRSKSSNMVSVGSLPVYVPTSLHSYKHPNPVFSPTRSSSTICGYDDSKHTSSLPPTPSTVYTPWPGALSQSTPPEGHKLTPSSFSNDCSPSL